MSLEEDAKFTSRATRYNYLSEKKPGHNPIFPNTHRKSSLSQQGVNPATPFTNPVEITAKNQQEQALLSAIYNTIAISVFSACLGLLAALFIVLEAFLKPIFWALLTSAFLFSSKRYLTDVARLRLADIEKRDKTLALECLVAPFQLVDSGIDLFWSFLKKNVSRLAGLVALILLFNVVDSYYETFVQALSFVISSMHSVGEPFNFFCTLYHSRTALIRARWDQNN